MWTSKKELQTALKLAVQSKAEAYPAFVELGPSAPPKAENAPHGPHWKGNAVLRSCCGRWETKFYFSAPLEQTIRVPFELFKNAVGTLDNRECELVVQGGILTLWQGKDYLQIGELAFGEGVQNDLPQFNLPPDGEVQSWLNTRETAAVADILKQILHFTNEEGPGSEVYLENRTGAYAGLEQLLMFCSDGYIAAAGRVRVERMGGLGLFLVPVGAVKKLARALKLLPPAGLMLTLGGPYLRFTAGRFEVTARLLEKQFLSPEIVKARGIEAALELDRGELMSFAKKASWAEVDIRFKYQDGHLHASGGGKTFSWDGRLSSGQEQPPQQLQFEFRVNAQRLLRALKGIEAAQVWLYYQPGGKLVYFKAGNIDMVLVAEKPKQEEQKNG